MSTTLKKTFTKPVARPGAFKALIEVGQVPLTGAKNHFSFSDEGINRLAETVAAKGYRKEQATNSEPMEQEDYFDAVHRMVSMGAAKSMAAALTTTEQNTYGYGLGKLAQSSVGLPPFLVPILDSLGAVEGPDQKWHMAGQPAWALSLLLRAAAPEMIPYGQVNQHINRREGFAVNVRWNRPYQPLLEVCKGYVNGWASSTPPQVFVLGGGQVVMSVPQIQTGFVVYAQLVQHVPRSARVQWALEVGAMLEGLIGGVQLNDGHVGALNGHNVVIVDWSNNQYSEVLGAYGRAVSDKLEHSIEALFGWAVVTGMSKEGAMSQIAMRRADELVTTPVQLASDQLEIAWMMSSTEVFYQLNQANYALSSQLTAEEAVRKIVDKAMGKT